MFEMKQLSALDVLKILQICFNLKYSQTWMKKILRRYYLKYMSHVLENLNFKNSFYLGHWFNGKLALRKCQSWFLDSKFGWFILSHIFHLWYHFVKYAKESKVIQDSVLTRGNAGKRNPLFGIFYVVCLLLKHWFFTKIGVWPQNNCKKTIFGNFWILFFSFSNGKEIMELQRSISDLAKYIWGSYTAQKMKFSIQNFFSKFDRIRSFLLIWSHLLKKSLMENFIFCAVL